MISILIAQLLVQSSSKRLPLAANRSRYKEPQTNIKWKAQIRDVHQVLLFGVWKPWEHVGEIIVGGKECRNTTKIWPTELTKQAYRNLKILKKNHKACMDQC